jgi:AAA domain
MSTSQIHDTSRPEGLSNLLDGNELIDPRPEGDDYEDAPDELGTDRSCWFEVDSTNPKVLYFRGNRRSEQHEKVTKEEPLETDQTRPSMPTWLQGVPILPHYDADKIGSMPEASWLAHEVLGEAGIALLYGAPQQGKSALVLDLAISVALGVPWAGRPLKCGNVLYGVLEGAVGFRRRALAAEAQLGISLGKRLIFFEEPVNLMKDEDVLKVIKLVLIKKCKLVIIDTLASSLAGEGDENSNRDMSKFLHGAKRIAKETGAAVLIIHHTGRDPNATMERGASALRGNVDTSIRVSKGDKHYKWEVVKSRDGPLGVSGAFDIEPYEFIRQDTGEVVQSIVVKHLEIDGEGTGATNTQSAKLHGNQAAVLAQLKIQFAGLPEVGASMPFEDAVRLCRDAVTVNDSKHRSTRTREVLRSLVRTGHIHEREDGQLCLSAA